MAQNNHDCYRQWPANWPPKPRDPEPELKDMTPAQIHQKHGPEVAAYIVELRSQVGMWKRLFNHRRSESENDG